MGLRDVRDLDVTGAALADPSSGLGHGGRAALGGAQRFGASGTTSHGITATLSSRSAAPIA
jgi:hypothetical protein